MRKLFETDFDFVLTIVRVVLGVIFVAHGVQLVVPPDMIPESLAELRGKGLEETYNRFTQPPPNGSGLPGPLAYGIIFGELLGGVALVIGFLGRLAALGIGAIMVGAIVTVHSKVGFFMNWWNVPGHGEGYEFHLLAIAAALVIVVKGSGALSLDRFLAGGRDDVKVRTES